MLYCFDVDGTLIRSFMREQGRTRDFEHVCPCCGAEGTLEVRAGTGEWHCELCTWHGDEADAVYDRVEVLQGRRHRIEALALRAGARFALVTNQGGVAFGYQTAPRVWRKLGRVLAEFDFFHGCPVSVHACFWHPNATIETWRLDSWHRKPGPGMLLDAMVRHRSDPATTWMVGDMQSDREAADAAGVRYFDQGEFFG